MEGIPTDKVNELTVEKTVKMCRASARSDVVKSILASTKFDNPKEVVSKLIIEIGNHHEEKQILAYRGFRNQQNNQPNNRNNQFNRNGQNRNFQSTSQNNRNGNSNFHRGQSSQQNRNGNSNGNHNNGHNGNRNRYNNNSNSNQHNGGYRGNNNNNNMNHGQRQVHVVQNQQQLQSLNQGNSLRTIMPFLLLFPGEIYPVFMGIPYQILVWSWCMLSYHLF